MSQPINDQRTKLQTMAQVVLNRQTEVRKEVKEKKTQGSHMLRRSFKISFRITKWKSYIIIIPTVKS